MSKKYLPGGSLNPYWVLNQKKQIHDNEEVELGNELDDILEDCTIDRDVATIEMRKLTPVVRVPITLNDELEAKFNFVKRHSKDPNDLQLAREIVGLPK
jgi:hypothetical protein